MFKKLFSVVFLMITMAPVANAWHLTTLQSVHTRHNGAFAFKTTSDNPSSPCTSKSTYEVLATDKTTARDMLAVVLAAYTSKQPIAIAITSSCVNGNVVAEHVMIGNWFSP